MTLRARRLQVLRAAAALVAEHLQPPARAQATAATLAQIADIPEVAVLPLSTLQLCDGLLAAAEARVDDVPPTTSRRQTCCDIADALPRWLSAREAAPQAAAVWRAVAEHFPGDDGRAEAIRATWAREAAEIAARAPQRRRADPIGLQANIPTGRQKRPGFGVRGFERGAVTVFDFADDGASFARACDALVAAGFAVTDCSPARGSDFVRFGAARVTRPA